MLTIFALKSNLLPGIFLLLFLFLFLFLLSPFQLLTLLLTLVSSDYDTLEKQIEESDRPSDHKVQTKALTKKCLEFSERLMQSLLKLGLFLFLFLSFFSFSFSFFFLFLFLFSFSFSFSFSCFILVLTFFLSLDEIQGGSQESRAKRKEQARTINALMDQMDSLKDRVRFAHTHCTHTPHTTYYM